MREFGIGQSLPRTEDFRLVRGQGRFTDDIVPPRSTRMFVVRSTHGCARIGGIDSAAALESPGVLAILTGVDAAADELGGFSSMVRRSGPDGEPNFEPPFVVMAHEITRYIGEPVALVIAETLDQAKTAAELIEIDYEPLDCITDLDRAGDPGVAEVWPDQCPGNLCVDTEMGDRERTDAAFAAAAHVAKVDFVISRVNPATLEPRTAIGEWDEGEGRYILHAALQGPHTIRGELARHVFRIPEDRIRVIAPEVGGGFGQKGIPHPEVALVLWAARKVGRPVRWTAERSEGFLSDAHARDMLVHAELALDADAKFLGLRVSSRANFGAYLTIAGVHCAVGNLGGLSGVYVMPTIHAHVRGYFTHTVPIGPYRGAGRPEASIMVERAIDVAAHQIGMDAGELRRRNLIQPEAMPYDTGFVFTYDSGDFPTSQARAQAMADWDGFEARRAEALERGCLRGLGMSHVIEVAAAQLDEMAEIEIDRSGGVSVIVGTHSEGQGHETSFRQLISEFLHVPMDRIRIKFGDSDLLPYGFGCGGSRTAVIAGNMLKIVSDKVIDQAKGIAATMLEVAPETIDYAEQVFTARATNATVSLEEVAARAYQPMHLPPGTMPGLCHREMVRLPAPTFPNGCHICEVEIDMATGQLSVIGYWVCEDVGKAINPMIVEGQMHGGVAQGLGQAFGELIRYDDDGQLLTGSFMDYQMPRALDLPPIQIAHNDVPSRNNPLGIKGAGESGTVGALPAGVNAVCDALWPLGITNFDMPATPGRLWRAIRDARPGRDAA